MSTWVLSCPVSALSGWRAMLPTAGSADITVISCWQTYLKRNDKCWRPVGGGAHRGDGGRVRHLPHCGPLLCSHSLLLPDGEYIWTFRDFDRTILVGTSPLSTLFSQIIIVLHFYYYIHKYEDTVLVIAEHITLILWHYKFFKEIKASVFLPLLANLCHVYKIESQLSPSTIGHRE